jgi:putative endonuclease
MRDHLYFVYIMASGRNGTLYTGVTNDVFARAREHRAKRVPGFTAKYSVTRLVWFERWGDINGAIGREKAVKRWRRAWKLALIEASNPQWLDLLERAEAEAQVGPLSGVELYPVQ